MNCNELKQHLMPFADGELEPKLAAEVEEALEGCPDCREELAEIRRVSAAARTAFVAPVEAVNLDGVYDAVMSRLSTAVEPAAAPGLWVRFSKWCSEVVRLERPMVLVGAAVAVLIAVIGVSMSQGESTSSLAPGPTVADQSPELKRRGAEGEVKAMGKNTAFVESLTTDKGTAYVEFDKDDPEAPLVLWHVVDDEGVPTPKGL